MRAVKLDCFRAQAVKTSGRVHFRSRNHKDFNVNYPAIAQALALIPEETVIDGEIVALWMQPAGRSGPPKWLRQRTAYLLRARRHDSRLQECDERAPERVPRIVARAGAGEIGRADPRITDVGSPSAGFD
jgi:hypothetical protein